MESQPNHGRKERSLTERVAEASLFFIGQGPIHIALTRLAKDLKEHRIEYMVIGAIALFEHGYSRFTEDIDIVLTREGLEAFHRQLIGFGYVPTLPGAKEKSR